MGINEKSFLSCRFTLLFTWSVLISFVKKARLSSVLLAFSSLLLVILWSQCGVELQTSVYYPAMDGMKEKFDSVLLEA